MKRRILWCILCACLASTSLFDELPANAKNYIKTIEDTRLVSLHRSLRS